MKKNDYEQWKEWLDKWNINYKEKTWHKDVKELTVDVASILFDLDNNFIRMTAYE